MVVTLAPRDDLSPSPAAGERVGERGDRCSRRWREVHLLSPTLSSGGGEGDTFQRSLLLALVLLAACTPSSRGAEVGTPCSASETEITCAPRIDTIPVNGLLREVFWQAPAGDAPAAGRPAVIVFQGSFFGPPSTWGAVKPDLAFGGFHQARLQVMLLARGYTVIAPSAAAGLAWQTNSTLPWDATTDKQVIDALVADIGSGRFGPIDTSRLYATGISSGGYMTSRMALSYAGTFKALGIAAGSWATCAGAACVLPAALPADHPPTLFLHGRADVTVPLFTAESYVKALEAQGTEAPLVIDDAAGHEWLKTSPERISDFFDSH